jgi:membrane protein YqaA with SNARE-associated domain
LAKSGGGSRNPWILILLLVAGSLVGSLLGQLLGSYLPFLRSLQAEVRLVPRAFELADVFSITFGFAFKLNIATIVGMALAIWVYRRV